MLYPTLTKTRSLYDLSGLWQFKLGEHNPEKDLSPGRSDGSTNFL